MKNASPARLALIRPLLEALRELPGVEERGPGRFDHARAALLSFHAEAGALFADLRVEGEWKRYPLETVAQRAALLKRVKAGLPTAKAAAPREPRHGRAVHHGLKVEPRARPRVRRAKRNAR